MLLLLKQLVSKLDGWHDRIGKLLATIANGKVVVTLILSALGFGYFGLVDLPASSQNRYNQYNDGDGVQNFNQQFHHNKGNTNYGDGNTLKYYEDNSTSIHQGEKKITAHEGVNELLVECPSVIDTLSILKGTISLGKSRKVTTKPYVFVVDMGYMRDFLNKQDFSFINEHESDILDDIHYLLVARNDLRNGSGGFAVRDDFVEQKVAYLKGVLPRYCSTISKAYEQGKTYYE